MKLNLENFEDIFVFKSLTDEEYFTNVNDFTKLEYFKNASNSTIYNLLKQYYNKRGVLPSLTELKNYVNTPLEKQAYKEVLTKISQTNKQFNREELFGNTERFLKERALEHTLLDVAESFNTKQFDTSKILDKFEKCCNIDLSADIGLDFFNNYDAVVRDLSRENHVIPSTWKWLDKQLDGGFQQNGRALYVFAGQTNVGKSIFLGNIASNIASQGKTVLLITLEMSELVYARRLSSHITKVPIRDLKKDAAILKELVLNERAKNSKSRIIIKEFPPSSMTPAQISAFIKRLQKLGIHIDAVVLDYLNLLTTSEGSNSYEKIKYLTEQIRALTYIFNCPWITATQLNKTGYNIAAPDLTTIGESYGMGATADFIASLYQLEEDAEHNIIRCGLMKNRFGPNFGSTAFRLDYTTLSISEDDIIASLTDASEDARNTLAAFAA